MLIVNDFDDDVVGGVVVDCVGVKDCCDCVDCCFDCFCCDDNELFDCFGVGFINKASGRIDCVDCVGNCCCFD